MDQKAQAESRVGMTLCNKWTLEKLLGVGGMAAVYVARHKIGRREAIKILHRDVANSPDLRARFEAEAHAVNRFRHPGAVEIRDTDVSDDGSPFLVMELLEGEALSERVRRLGDLPVGELLAYMDELLDVLAAAHAQGIIHRDIKLDNLFIQNDGHLKVLDFGIARFRNGLPQNVRTRLGAALGTAPYMPPEQVKGIEIDGRADIFAVGATMFRLIAKRRIHDAKTESEMLVKMATQPAPSLASVAPGAPRELCMLVDRALMFQREQRYPDAIAMQADVRALRAGAAPPYASARLADATSPQREAATIMVGPAAASADPPTRNVPTPPGSLAELPTRGGGALTPLAPLSELPTRGGGPAPAPMSVMAPLSELPTRNVPTPAGALAPAVSMFEAAPTSIAVLPPQALSAGPVSTSIGHEPTLYASAPAPSPAANAPLTMATAAVPPSPAQGTPASVGPVSAMMGQMLASGPASAATPPAPQDDPSTFARGPGKLPLGFEPTLKSAQPVALPASSSSSGGAGYTPAPPQAAPVVPVVQPGPVSTKGPDQKMILIIAVGLIFALVGAVVTLAWMLRDKKNSDAPSTQSSSAPLPEDKSKGMIIGPRKK